MSPYVEIQEQVIWGLGNIAGDGPPNREKVFESGAANLISDILDSKQHHEDSFIRQASWALSNLCRGRPTPNIDLVTRCIPSLCKILKSHNSTEIIGDICWALSYISDGGIEFCTLIVSQDILRRLIELFDHEDLSVVISSLRSIGNCLTGDDEMC